MERTTTRGERPTADSLRSRRGVSIEFVNHASFIVEFNGVRIISDPWFFGSAFNDGWRLLCDVPFDLERFREIDYIWISHEHPDHFSPHVLNSIPEEIRRNVTVLFQATKDQKVLDFCSRIGFQTRELPHLESIDLAGGLQVICGSVPSDDSWIFYKCGGSGILNLNDCSVDVAGRASTIAEAVGRVDLLLTQFSYAGWNGNAADTDMRRRAAAAKLGAMRAQIQAFQPEWTIPFASFAYFSHEENRHCNDAVNTPHDAAGAVVAAGSKAVVMYPGDRWAVGAHWENRPALQRYERHYDLADREFATSVGVSDSELRESARRYVERVRARNNRFLLKCIRWFPLIGALRPIDMRVPDIDCTYRFSFEGGLVRMASDGSYDVMMSSSSLDYLFRFDWGIDTLMINGRFEAGLSGVKRMKKTFAVGAINNTGRRLGLRLLLDVAFLRMLRDAAGRLRRRGR